MPYNSIAEAVLNLTVPTCMFALFISIGINFFLYDKEASVVTYKKSPVETFSMTAFVVVLYLIVMSRQGQYQTNQLTLIIAYSGVLLFIFGTGFNIVGRYYLGSNWSNQVRLKTTHTLVTSGPYRIVRHPLYASIVWMIFAAGLIYSNYIVIILNMVVFIPLMTFRAHQEEKVLMTQFDDYLYFKKKTGLFFPKLRRSK